MAATEISLWLDSYDDIYSDFDSRHYLKRRLSEDFIDELKASLNFKKSPTTQLTLLIPPSKRKEDIESGMITSMKDQFHIRFDMLYKKERQLYRKGMLYVIIGALVMALDSFVAYFAPQTYPAVLFRIMLEPGSWFLIWNGLELLIYDYRKAKQETIFYKNVEQLNISFKDLNS